LSMPTANAGVASGLKRRSRTSTSLGLMIFIDVA
jgi:hypothetical protein